MLKLNLFLWIVVLFVFFGIANGKVLIVDDFEKDSIGKEPANWEHLNFADGNSIITVEKDTQNPNNKVAKAKGIGLYIPNVAGRDNWTDYICDFDWMWENDSYVGIIYRVEGVEAHFHSSRRVGGSDINIYTRKAGAWAQIATGKFTNEINVWYSHRLIIKGNKHQIYLKKRDDNTTFDKLKPVVEADNDTFKKGPFGMMGITTGVNYFDNIVIAENLQDFENLKAVERKGKLTITWGNIKNP